MFLASAARNEHMNRRATHCSMISVPSLGHRLTWARLPESASYFIVLFTWKRERHVKSNWDQMTLKQTLQLGSHSHYGKIIFIMRPTASKPLVYNMSENEMSETFLDFEVTPSKCLFCQSKSPNPQSNQFTRILTTKTANPHIWQANILIPTQEKENLMSESFGNYHSKLPAGPHLQRFSVYLNSVFISFRCIYYESIQTATAIFIHSLLMKRMHLSSVLFEV